MKDLSNLQLKLPLLQLETITLSIVPCSHRELCVSGVSNIWPAGHIQPVEPCDLACGSSHGVNLVCELDLAP